MLKGRVNKAVGYNPAFQTGTRSHALRHQGNMVMLQTYEALLQSDGHIEFLEVIPESIGEKRRVLVTFTEPADKPAVPPTDWRSLVGTLQNSPNLNGDPVMLQQDIRHEWD